ncbi:hypothetical protein ACIPPJ_35300 [Streptomyces sp. NPDC086091]|uniref:hypothetical protein n=1 Tax=Streptomyces sp. NPDC086091 TaxID=3365751 RepID=UPI00380F4BB1
MASVRTSKPDDVKDPPDAGDRDDKRSFKEKVKDFFTKPGEGTTPPEPEEPPRSVKPEDLGYTMDRPDRPDRSSGPTEAAEEDVVDAVVVDDPIDPFGATVTVKPGLPRAPEPHTKRPGTTRPTSSPPAEPAPADTTPADAASTDNEPTLTTATTTQEDPVASAVSRPPSGQAGMAAQHRTDITLGEYLTDMVNITIAAKLDKDRAQDLALALGKVADALRDMAADLNGDHNIATAVVDQVTGLADAAGRMKKSAERCAHECENASEAAFLTVKHVGRVYGEDMQAMEAVGLTQASAAAHHD